MTASLEKLRPTSWAERGATFVVFLTLGILVGAWAAALPGLRLRLGLSNAGLSLALLTLSIGSVLSTIATGFVAPRLGTGRITSLGALAAVVGLALPPLAGSLTELAAATFLVGTTIGMLDVALNGHAGDIEHRWGVPIMSSFHAAFSLGGLAGSGLGGLIAWAGWGVESQMWVPVSLAGLSNVAVLPFLGRGPSRQTSGGSFGWPERSMLWLSVIVFMAFLIEGAMADWSAVYLSSVGGASLAAAAAGYAAFSIAMATGRLAGDTVVGRLGPRHVVAAGGALAAVGLALAVALPQAPATILGFALVGFGAANMVPVVFSAAARAGASPAAGVAKVAVVGYAGFLSGPPLIGSIASLADLRIAVAGLVLAAALTAVAGLSAFGRQRAVG